MNYRECAKLLREQDHILILTHRDPDGDTAGSAAALCSALRRLGKQAEAVDEILVPLRLDADLREDPQVDMGCGAGGHGDAAALAGRAGELLEGRAQIRHGDGAADEPRAQFDREQDDVQRDAQRRGDYAAGQPRGGGGGRIRAGGKAPDEKCQHNGSFICFMLLYTQNERRATAAHHSNSRSCALKKS